MADASVLLVEAETAQRAYLEHQLAEDGFAVVAVSAGVDALELLERARPDLVLLDVALPDRSGFELCRALREGEPGRRWDRDVPVILVGPAADPVDRVRGFARGADDYVGTPIVYEELVARMRAVLRRATGGRARETIVVGGLEIDRPARVVRLGGRALELSAKEFELLAALAAEPDRVWTKDELLRGVWGFRSTGRTRTLESHASRLRRKLNADGDARWIVNVWGVGYKLV